MHWLQTLDIDLFRFANLELANPVFDAVMPLLSGNRCFLPVLALQEVREDSAGGSERTWKIKEAEPATERL